MSTKRLDPRLAVRLLDANSKHASSPQATTIITLDVLVSIFFLAVVECVVKAHPQGNDETYGQTTITDGHKKPVGSIPSCHEFLWRHINSG